VSFGAIVLLVVSTSFMLAGAAVLYPMLQSGELKSAFEGWSLLTEQGTIWVVSFLATNAGVAVAMLAALYLNFQLPPLYRTRWWMLVASVISAIILVAVSLISGWELAKSTVM
jgi:hypothetical protein